MKKFLILMLTICFVGSAGGDITFDQDNYKKYRTNALTAFGNDPIFNFIGEVEGIFEGTSSTEITNLLFDNAITSDPTSTEGRLYYNTSINKFKYYNGGSWIIIEAGSSGNSLDGAYDVGSSITVDAGPVTLTTSTASGIIAMSIDHGGASNNSDGLAIAHAGSGDGIQVTNEDTDSVAARFISAASQTVSLVVFDASTNNWDGADNVGLLHLQTDDPFIHAGASALFISDSSTPITAAEGFLARFVHSGIARTNSSAVEIEVPATQPALAINGIVAISGQDNPGAVLLQLTAIDTTGDQDAMTIANSGAGDSLQISPVDVDTGGINVVGKAAGIVSLIKLDSATNNWDGADNVGQLLIDNDDAYVHAGAAGLVVTDSSTPITSAEGFLARFIHSGSARTNSSAVQIVVPATQPALAIDGIVALTGQDNPGAALFQVIGIDTTGNTDTATIDHSGSGNALYIDLNEADSQGITVEPFTNATVAALEVDGDAAGWLGADDVGMVHLRNDIPTTNAGASLLLIDDSSQPISAAEGFLARFVHSGTARTNSSAVEIEVPTTQPALAMNGILAITGQDSPGAVLVQIVGNDGTGNSNTMSINTEGTGDGLIITCDDADSVAFNAVAATSQTTSLATFDGATGSWLGAQNVGMLHVTSDGALAHVDSSLLYIANSGVPQDDSRGSSLRIVDTGNASAGTAGYAVYVSATDATVEALFIDDGKVLIDESIRATKGVQFGVGETLTANSSEGAAQQVDDDISVANVTAVNAGVADFITLPNDPAIGTIVYVLCNATSNFEIRTLLAGNDKINNVDTSDAAVEYLATDTDTIVFTFTKADTWIGVSYTKLGAVRTAVVPD